MATSDTPARRILVVDDEPLVCDSLKRMLTVDGYQVQTALTAEAALALLEQENFDLVITDYDMPSMKGDKLAAAIKASHPNRPVALITAYAELLQTQGTPLSGVDAVISKPFDLKEFRQAIAQLLAGKPASPGTTGN